MHDRHSRSAFAVAVAILVSLVALAVPTDAASAPKAPRVTVQVPSTVEGVVPIGITATGSGIVTLKLFLDGALVASYSTADATYHWDSTTVANGVHKLRARAVNSKGRVVASPAVSVVVANVAPAEPPGAETPESLVTALYQELLGRVPDPDGLAYWADWLRQGASSEDVRLQILNSEEYYSKHDGSTAPPPPAPPAPPPPPAPPLAEPPPAPPPAAATGTLRVLSTNPRYFTTGDGKAVYLTGSHTWNNFQGNGSPPSSKPDLDFSVYLDTLSQYGHNFIRLWTWEDSRRAPLPWGRRPDGKFDLNQWNQAYFDRLRQYCLAAQQRGIYVGIMLFQGWSIEEKVDSNQWPLHPFHRSNNVNGIDGDPGNTGNGTAVHTLQIPAITARQKRYVEKVIDAVNDLDNVLYEISNESNVYSIEWHYEMIRHIKQYEAGKLKQHLVGMSAVWSPGYWGPEFNFALFDSPADWVGPHGAFDYKDDVTPADGGKPIILDTDHIWGVGGEHDWVWRAFTRGHHTIFMDRAAPLSNGVIPGAEPDAVPQRRAMGATAMYASRMALANMSPRGDLTSTGHALANPGSEYLVYQPKGGAFWVILAPGTYTVEWYDPKTSAVVPGGTVTNATTVFEAPFGGDAVLYLR